ncbi:MAG: sarcosine oxidase subunit gamma [Streptosporangiaceae bacterium]
MSDYPVVARSPIPPLPPVRVVDGWEVSGCRSVAPLTITDCTPLAKVHLQASWNGAIAKALGVPFGRASRDGGRLIAGSGPGEWLVLAPVGTAAQVVSWLGKLASEAAPEEFVSVLDLTHGRALVRITGRKVAELLAKLCGVDLADDLTPDGAAFRAPVAAVTTDVIRDDRGVTPSYLLHCERSSGQYLYSALVSAGESLGLGVDGFRAPEPGPSGIGPLNLSQ